MSDASPQVATAEQAAVLLDVPMRPLLHLLMTADRSAGELASALHLSPQRMHYLLGKLVRAGVAEVAWVQPRAGRPIKRYRVAPRWFVPFEVTGAETLAAFLEAQILPRLQQFILLALRQIGPTFQQWGFWLDTVNGTANLHMGDLQDEGRDLFEGDEPFLFNIGAVHLTREQAPELKRRLLAVLADFDVSPAEASQPYALALMLTQGEVG